MTDLALDQIDPRLLEQLPTLPATAVEFLRLCDDPTTGVRDVAEVAKHDPGLLARILQVANSPFYAPREPVTDITRAAAILGLRSLKMIGVGFAILGDLWNGTENSEQLAGVIGASAMAGSGARSFSSRLGTGRDEEALTSGLLSFVGELALLRCFPEEFTAAWEQAGGLPPADAQRAALGVDGATLGSLLMERWSMPDDLRDGVRVRLQSNEDRLHRSPSVFDASLGFGTAIAELLTGGESALAKIRPAARAWGLDEEDLLGFWGEFRIAARRTSQQLGLDVGAELDRVIVDAKDEYMSSMVHAAAELDAAQRQIAELQQENARLEGLSLQDPLTGVANRPAFDGFLRSSLASMSRTNSRKVAVAILDLDRFKQINDNEGHLVGDALLTAIAQAGQQSSRADELFARLGGDEFAMVLRPDSMEELELAINRVRADMNAAAVATLGTAQCTVSAGAALLEHLDIDMDLAVKRLTQTADDALYAAKRRGRNRAFVTVAMRTGLVSGSLDA